MMVTASRQKRLRRVSGKTRIGAVFIAFLALIGLMLAYEHRAHDFSGSGLLLLLVLLCPPMHLFMHDGHGEHDN